MTKEFENKVMENSVLAKFLGMEDIQDLRQMIKEVIAEQIRKDLRNSSYYIISPDDVNSILGDIVTEACNEIDTIYCISEEEILQDVVGKWQ